MRVKITLFLLAVTTLPLALSAALQGFSFFDDEGTLLAWFLSIRDGFIVYDEIYFLYGPFYAVVYGIIYAGMGVPITHTAGRIMAACLWVAYSAGFAAFVYRVAGARLSVIIPYAAVMLWLPSLMNSPGHPEELCLLLTATALLLTCSAARAPSLIKWIALGAVLASLALTKINIGAMIGGPIGLVILAFLG